MWSGVPFLRRKPKRVAHIAPFGAARLTNHPAPTVPAGTRDITFAAPKRSRNLVIFMAGAQVGCPTDAWSRLGGSGYAR
jgi:hypothetical protein